MSVRIARRMSYAEVWSTLHRRVTISANTRKSRQNVKLATSPQHAIFTNRCDYRDLDAILAVAPLSFPRSASLQQLDLRVPIPVLESSRTV